MINEGRHPVLGVGVWAVDYDYAVDRVIAAAKDSRPYSVGALAVHGVMTGHLDDEHARRLNSLDLVVPDGQPVRWALNWLHGTGIPDRVTGPELTLRVLAACERERLPVYFYGSRREVLDRLTSKLGERYPDLIVAGAEPSCFRQIEEAEARALAARIRRSGARVVFAGLGCPRQEVWAFEYRDLVSLPILAVGAAFDFHAGLLRLAPAPLQRWGLEWAYRFVQEPRRLWRRYLLLNPLYLWRVGLQKLSGADAALQQSRGDERKLYYG